VTARVALTDVVAVCEEQVLRISLLPRLRIDPYIMALLATVAIAALLPARGVVATGFSDATAIAISFLFFLYGARLSTKEVIDGLAHWRLHLIVFASTFLLFPVLGLVAKLLVPGMLTPGRYAYAVPPDPADDMRVAGPPLRPGRVRAVW
jgi:uncharacterized membrane protein YadS